MYLNEAQVFILLIGEVLKKYDGRSFSRPTKKEANDICQKITQTTGASISGRSLWNFCTFAKESENLSQQELQQSWIDLNPSSYLRDALARYVLEGPKLEIDKTHENYWILYFNRRNKRDGKRRSLAYLLIFILVLGGLSFAYFHKKESYFYTDFDCVSESCLEDSAWSVLFVDSLYWSQRGKKAGYLGLATLRGDLWPSKGQKSMAYNMLVRPLPPSNFQLTVHMANFFPSQNWQQAGIVLLEDTTDIGNNLRFTLEKNYYDPELEKLNFRLSCIRVERSEAVFNDGKFEATLSGSNLKGLTDTTVYRDLWLRIERKGEDYYLFDRKHNTNRPYRITKLAAAQTNIVPAPYFSPKFVGLVSFQGWTNQAYEAFDADTIMAYFDSFELIER